MATILEIPVIQVPVWQYTNLSHSYYRYCTVLYKCSPNKYKYISNISQVPVFI